MVDSLLGLGSGLSDLWNYNRTNWQFDQTQRQNLDVILTDRWVSTFLRSAPRTTEPFLL